jgi:acetylglutamate synthase
LSRDAFADVGKAVDASFGNRYSGTWTHVFDRVADNVLQSASSTINSLSSVKDI